MPKLELFGAASCPYTPKMRVWLEWNGSEYAQYDVSVPVLVEDRKVSRVGWEGPGCIV